jgi:hypothetical protein
MAKLGKEAYERTNRQLADREARLLLEQQVNWEKLRPQVGESELYERLIAAVEEATEKNNNLAVLKSRLEELGAEGVKLSRKVIELLS